MKKSVSKIINNEVNNMEKQKELLNNLNEKTSLIDLQEYIKSFKSDTCGTDNSLGIINRWWESEDEDIENFTNKLLNELKNNYKC